jgi:hypothetical protein
MALAEIGSSAKQGGTCIVVETEYRDRDLIRIIPGSKYDADMYRWTAPLTWSTCKVLRGVFQERLRIGPDLVQWATTEKRDRIDPALQARFLMDAPGDEDLYPFQRAGVRFLTTARRALLCDSMGTGKTVQTIRTLKTYQDRGENPFPALIICPNTRRPSQQAGQADRDSRARADHELRVAA